MKCFDFIFESLLNIIFPPLCVVCKIALAEGVACGPCLLKIPLNKTFFCALCGARIPGTKKICHPQAPYLLGAAGPYDNATLKLLVRNLKFRGMRRAAEPLAALIAQYLTDIKIDVSGYLLIPLPLSRRRKNERGFNQAEEIAKHLAERLPVELKTDILMRIRHTKPQTETGNVAERRLNVLGCFAVAQQGSVAGKNIILLDDVTTSGATLGEAAHALKNRGARNIIGIAAAKA